MKNKIIAIALSVLVIFTLSGCAKKQSVKKRKKIKTYLSFSASPADLNLRYGKVISFAGQLRARGETGLPVKTILIQKNDAGRWNTLLNKITNANGYYTGKYYPRAGSYRFRAIFDGDSSYLPSDDSQRVTVR